MSMKLSQVFSGLLVHVNLVVCLQLIIANTNLTTFLCFAEKVRGKVQSASLTVSSVLGLLCAVTENMNEQGVHCKRVDQSPFVF